MAGFLVVFCFSGGVAVFQGFPPSPPSPSLSSLLFPPPMAGAPGPAAAAHLLIMQGRLRQALPGHQREAWESTGPFAGQRRSGRRGRSGRGSRGHRSARRPTEGAFCHGGVSGRAAQGCRCAGQCQRGGSISGVLGFSSQGEGRKGFPTRLSTLAHSSTPSLRPLPLPRSEERCCSSSSPLQRTRCLPTVSWSCAGTHIHTHTHSSLTHSLSPSLSHTLTLTLSGALEQSQLHAELSSWRRPDPNQPTAEELVSAMSASTKGAFTALHAAVDRCVSFTGEQRGQCF